jgi:DNA-binding transcriptional regulator LsrR (DeoR family)
MEIPPEMPPPSKQPLNWDDAKIVWSLHRVGWHQHQIAARFGCNSARINDILKERKHVGSKDEPDDTAH